MLWLRHSIIRWRDIGASTFFKSTTKTFHLSELSCRSLSSEITAGEDKEKKGRNFGTILSCHSPQLADL